MVSKTMLGTNWKVRCRSRRIVVRAVGSNGLCRTISRKAEVTSRQRVDQGMSVRQADLQQAQLFGIRVQAVTSCVEGDPLGGLDLGEESRQMLFIQSLA